MLKDTCAETKQNCVLLPFLSDLIYFTFADKHIYIYFGDMKVKVIKI